MKKHRTLLLSLFFLLFCLVLSGCNSTPADDDSAKTYRVMVSVSDGCTVLPSATQEVEAGANAVFEIQFADGYVFASADAGTFDAEANTLTLENVTKATLITLTAEKVEYDTNATVEFLFRTSSTLDQSSVDSYTDVAYGTEITVSAKDTARYFLGWSVGDSDTILSASRTYTFRVTPDLVEDGTLLIRANYTRINIYAYNANGGSINKTTVNAKGNDFYSANINGDVLTVTLSSNYLKRVTCATAFWNDGTFTRDGYVLKEYNTKPDGSGDTVLPGDKFYQRNPDGGDYVLYCIWEKADTSGFTYEDYTMALPSGIKANHAPDWHKNGVIITGYTGDADMLVIPEYIDGKPVIAIRKGAIQNKKFTTLYLPRTLQEVANGSFTGCSSLKRLYYPSGIWSMHDEAFDTETYKNWTEFFVYASIAPRYSSQEYGAYGIKLSRLLASENQKRIVLIAGSSALQGLGSAYLEALLDYDYTVINFGTTRTTHGSLYLEAMQHYTHEGDLVLFAPENSIYMMGDTALYWKTIRDMEALYQLFRYVDISAYTNVFDAFCEQNQSYTYKRAPENYECICNYGGMNIYGDDIKSNKNGYVNTSSTAFVNAYTLTFNNRFKSTNEGQWEKAGSQNDYNNNTYWVSIDDDVYKNHINRIVAQIQKSGASVYFSFAPSDGSTLIAAAKNTDWLNAYDQLLLDTFDFDGIVGSCKNYIYAHEYFFDCAFHTNNYGRTWRTYYLYTDLCEIIGREVQYQNGDLGTKFDQCLFEKDADGNVLTSPKYTLDYLK